MILAAFEAHNKNTSIVESHYSSSYREQFATAVVDSRKLGFTRDVIISEQKRVADDLLRETNGIVAELSALFDVMLPGYWGNSCQTLATNIFAHLNANDIPANIVLGNVIINGTDEFEVTLESLQAEVGATTPLTGHQDVHAWVSLGDDTIVDAALPPRLVRHYGAPDNFDDVILIGRAGQFAAKLGLVYQPILVGTEFFARTNPPDPMDLLHELKRRRRQG